MAKEPKTAATVPEVEEVSLVGRADLASWQERLAPYDLEPIERDGAAQVIIVASALRWGVRFRELSLTIAARPTGASSTALAVSMPPIGKIGRCDPPWATHAASGPTPRV